MRRSYLKTRPADNHLTRAEWDTIRHCLLCRSGGLCEARTPDCLAGPTGHLSRLILTSVQHRRAQGMGGTDRTDVHALPNLLIVCGDGTRGCHGWIETQERHAARLRGLWVPQALDPARVCVELSSGRLVQLDPWGGYAEHGWALAGTERPRIL